MRIITQIPHPNFRINIFGTEMHFYIEIEAGPMKQAYKLPKDKAVNVEGVQKWLNPAFLEGVQKQFEAMYKLHLASIESSLN